MSTVKPAASVLLHRQDGRVFWVRRGEQLRFAGGFYAFPGGRVDLDDAAVPLINGDHLGPLGAPIVVAAARELFEETGVLAVPKAERISAAERKQARAGLLDGTLSFAALLARHGLRVDAGQFLPAGRWVTPPSMPVRFDARFFLVELPPGEHAEVWPGELADGEWILPAGALARWESGSALLHPPAWHSLKALASVTSAREALPLLVDPSRAPWKLPVREGVVQRIEFQRGVVLVPLRSPTLLEYFLFAKPYFDPHGLIVAADGGKLIGFALAGFGPDASGARLDTANGVIGLIGVIPAYRKQGVGAELATRAEDYLRRRGARTLSAGPMEPLNPFTFGLYGGSQSPGFLDSDPTARPFFERRGYRVQETKLVFQRPLDRRSTLCRALFKDPSR